MPLPPGSRLGVFALIDLIGRGGMGEVYRARDTKLGRDVAIKILPEAFAHDADRLARFQREAKTLASLNHPNIAAIYGLEESAGMTALVMELVEGDDLSQQIARGAIPVDEALPIAKQIAEALEAAHEQGIIHRDLKPANIKVRSDGTVKVLDFGLAKAMEPTGAMSPVDSMSPTITTPAMTQAGMILGTAAYMSPEQARGKAVDKRADIWAFGAVLFEMLTGRRAFQGEDITDTIVAVISKEPDWAALPSTTPAGLRRLLSRCLKKDAKARLRDIGEARVQVEELLSGVSGESSATAADAATPRPGGTGPRQTSHVRLTRMAAVAAVVAAIVLAVPTLRHLRETPPPTPPETRTEIRTPATDQPTMFALSPDGGQIVFVASGDGASHLWVRSLATTTAQPLAGTEGARLPFWSPDGRSLAFFAGGALKRLDLGGGAPQTLAPVIAGFGGTWSAADVIVFAPGQTEPLMRVSATGGAAAAVTTLGPQQAGHVEPYFLPDGDRFLFFVRGTTETAGLYLGTLHASAVTRLTPADGSGVFLPSGWVLWVRAGTLVAQRLDVAKPALTGQPVTLAQDVTTDAATSLQSALSVSATGLVAYRTGEGSLRQLTRVDRSGTARGTVGDADATLLNPRVSPDGRRVSAARAVQGNPDIWLLDGARTSRVTFDAAIEWYPAWSPDGTRIAFRSQRSGAGDIYQKLTNGVGLEERLVASDQGKTPTDWSADGRFLLYNSTDPQTGNDIWVVPMVGARTPAVFLKTPFRELSAVFSPDGRWVAYHSNESGRPEVYVRPFVRPGAADTTTGEAGGQWQVSTTGGIMPLWRPDGRELYYLNPAGVMMAAPITVTGTMLAPGAPVALFPTRIHGGGADAQQGREYDVASDGRFLINTELDSSAAPITLLMNWNPETNK